MLPNLGALGLQAQRAEPTGEFVRLSRAEARKLNNAGVREPINRSMYMPSDCEPSDEEIFNRTKEDDYECFEPFRVWIRDPVTGRPGRQSNLYNAQALWDALGFMDKLRDPATRQPFWREDWLQLHQKFDPDGDLPRKVHALPRKDKDEGYDTEEEDEDDDDPNQAAMAVFNEEEDDDDDDPNQAAMAAFNDSPVRVWGRFWLKGLVTPDEQETMETFYFRDRLSDYLRTLHINLDDDTEEYEFSVRTDYYATSASEGPPMSPGDSQGPMPVTCVDFQLRFNRGRRALEFVRPGLTRWNTLAREMFGITVLFVGHPFSEYPTLEGPRDLGYGGPPRVPVIDRSRWDDQDYWEWDDQNYWGINSW